MTEEANKTENETINLVIEDVKPGPETVAHLGQARIKVIGVGGGGSNSVNNMIKNALGGVEFFAANTDAQALASSSAQTKIQLGAQVTRGLGAGADPEVGLAAAQESIEDIRKALEGADMVFIAACLGGGTGSFAASVIAEVAKDLGCLTVGVVTKPFVFEGKRRMRNADLGIERLRSAVDTLIIIPNQRLLSVSGRNTSLLDTFKKADDILYQAVRGISDLIINEGLVNVDFADVRAVMSEMGMAMMGTGDSSGENRAVEAAEKAISSPLLEDISIHGAKGVLINITASPDVTLQEINEAAELIHSEADPDANIIWGMVIDQDLEDTVRVTVVATGFGDRKATSKVVGNLQPRAAFQNTVALDQPTFARKEANGAKAEVVSLGGLSVLSKADEKDKFEIPPFLRKRMD